MRRLSIFAIALLAMGCSSHSSVVPRVSEISPEIFQKRTVDGWTWIYIGKINGQEAAPIRLTVDASQHIWVADEAGGGGISEVGMDQSVKTFPLSVTPIDIAFGSDQNLWVATGNGTVARVTPQGSESDYAVAPGSGIVNIISGPDGALWFTECGPRRVDGGIGTITTSGVYTFYPGTCMFTIATGPDGNIWYGDKGANIYSMTPQGQPLGKYSVGDTYFTALSTGPDGALYVIGGTPNGQNELVKISTTGTVTHIGNDHHFPVSTFGGIANGPDGKLWLSGSGRTVPRLTTFDPVTLQFGKTLKSPADGEIVLGPDGNFWIPYNRWVYTYVRLLMTITPKSIVIPKGQTADIKVSELNYSSQWTAVSGQPSIATVTPNSNHGHFVVTGVGSGTAVVTVSDTMYNSANVFVKVK